MLPTLAAQGDWVWTSHRYRLGRGIEVGDIISFKHPYVVGVLAIKRVVGMPGDFVMRDVHEGGNQTMLQVCVAGTGFLGWGMIIDESSRCLKVIAGCLEIT